MAAIEMQRHVSRPGATETRARELEGHRAQIGLVAYTLYEDRVLMARRERQTTPERPRGGWYLTEMIDRTPPHVLAESIVNQGNPAVVQAVFDRHDALVAEVGLPMAV